MRSHSHPLSSKARAGGGRTVFELKHRVVLSLNKLADRDTHQIGLEELEKIAEGLAPEGIPPFLSCVIDTDPEQKSAVRKECVRIMGTLARVHGSLLAPHLAKMVATIVKRLKDTDSVVRDACVEAAGVLATHVRSSAGGAAFVALARPLFEALGEQNRYVQAGSALCLARVIDETSDPPVSILPQMLTRVLKLLKNPHFMAKPAVIDLIRSIIQAGGASTEHALSAAVTGVLEALKSNDWTTRKSASVALANIGISTGSLLGGSFKTTCIRSLECCRFDKVKPVRDAIMHAIQCWKTLPGSDSPDPSEAGSSTKENIGGDYPDITSASDGGWRDTSFRKPGPISVLSGSSTSSARKRIPLGVRKTCQNYVQNHQHGKSNDWNIEISIPKTHATHFVGAYNKDSEGSCITRAFDRQVAEPTREQVIKYDIDLMDDKQECSSISDLVSGSFETKHVTVAHSCPDDGDSEDPIGMDHRSPRGETDPGGPRLQERKSVDSTVTDLSSRAMHECCLHAANELAFVRKQLLDIETKQSNLLDLLQVFMGNSIDSLSSLQMKVSKLEDVVDKIAEGFSRNDYSSVSSKLLKRNQSVSSSPRLSTCTPRPSVDANYGQPSLSSTRSKEMWVENAPSKGKSSSSTKGVDIWRDPTLNIIRNPIAKDIKKNSGRSVQDSGIRQAIDNKDMVSLLACTDSDKLIKLEGRAGFWKRIKGFLCAGDLESAYAEVLSSGDDLGLIQLMDKTGPVLEQLSHETVNEILSTMTMHFLNQRFLDSLIPWLQQVVDLSTSHETKRHFWSMKARPAFLSAVQGAAGMEFPAPADTISITQLALKLAQVWSESPRRKLPPQKK